MPGFNQVISSSTMASGDGFNNITQGVMKGNVPLPQVAVSPKVTQSIQQRVASTIDSSMIVFKDKLHASF